MKTILATIIILCCGLQVAAQSLSADTAVTVSLLTCAPGRDIYELEGHSGLRLKSSRADVVANWGLFDFDSPGFVYRFVKGETDYMAGLIPTEYFLHSYRMQRRRVTEQTLSLTPEQAAMVTRMVRENVKPENRVYRYNYVRDNCATRPLSLIGRAVADSIVLGHAAAPAGAAPPSTWRGWMRMYHRNYPWYQFGIDIALGSGIDARIGEHEAAFAPVALQQMAAGAQIIGPGGTRPLVSHTEILVDGPAEGTSDSATPWWRTPMAVMTLLAAAALWLTVRDLRRRRLTRWFDTIFYAALGAVSLIATFLIFISVHEATSPNWLYLWINPLTIAIAALSAAAPRWQRALALLQCINLCGIVAFAAVAATGVQWCNPAFIPLMLADTLRAATQILLSTRKPK